ncbi:MAG: bifunctional heptose 7-phosphate kinase/heptose 1-phosphate adenyltransferase [Planctomycetota bacterium]|nr:MAG: bifunctional heptose 7-phosphate kinase/heptose 1-phosphate adenyltransferase [Planctomycetota bacterium]
MWQRLLELLDAGQGAHVLVVGDFMIDRYLYGDAERISPEAPVPVLRVVGEEDALGGAGSVAADIAALGAVPHCVGITGQDAESGRIRALLGKLSADISGLIEVPGRPTTRKTRLVGLAQHRHRQQLIRVDDESADPVADAFADVMLGHAEKLMTQCRAVCIEDYNKGVVTQRLAQGVIAAAMRRGLTVLVDPASTNDYSRYAGATVITPNRTETEKVTGLRLRTIDSVRKNAAVIRDRCRTDHVCVTLDADGAALIGPDASFEHIPTKERDVYDVTGAGDEVLAAMALAVAAGGTLREAVALANVAGGLEVEKFGCVPITRDEVVGEIWLEHHEALGKVRTLQQLLPELARRRARHEKIAFTNGCFDLIHVGHVENFRFCKQHADVLVVGLNSDASVRSLDKGGNRPIVEQDDRAKVLAALSDVDYVVIFDEPTPQALIEAVRPDVLLKGQDWSGKIIAGQEFVEKNGGKVVLVPLVEGRSTTSLIDKIRRDG